MENICVVGRCSLPLMPRVREAQAGNGEALAVVVGVEQKVHYLATASVIRLNPAIRDRVKSGHREWHKT